MPTKQKQPEFDLTEVLTLLRMANGNSVRELIELHHYKRDTPVSGDSITFFSRVGLAGISKVGHNDVMDNNITFTSSEHTLYSTALHHVVPLYVDVTFTDVDFTARFIFDEYLGAYLDEDGNALEIEWEGEKIKSIEIPEAS